MNRSQKNLIALSFGFAALIALMQPGHAQTPSCGDRAEILEQLASRYHETRRGIGLAANNGVLEIFAAESGSWTILVTMPGGQTCLIASGDNYEAVREELPTAGKGV